MSEKLDRLQTALDRWYQQSKAELEAEASFLKKVKTSVDDMEVARVKTGTQYSNLIADTIAELLE